MVLRGQVGSEKPHGGEVHGSLREEVENNREAAGGASSLDAVVGLVLGEPQDGATVGEERGVAFPQVDIAGVELGEMGHDQDGDLSRSADEAQEMGDEVAVGEESE